MASFQSKLDVPEYISLEEAHEIIKLCENKKYKLVLRTMWETGARISEVLSLIPHNINKKNNCIFLPNLKQKPIRKKKSETDKEYEQRKATHEEWKKQRKQLIKEKKAPILDKHGPPLKRIFLFPESTLCQDLLEFAKEENIGDYNWIFKGNSDTGQISTTYIWYLLSSARGTSYSSDKWKRKQGLATVLGFNKIKGGLLKPAWPHLFRHGNAMNVYHRTGRLDVTQRQLGHSSIQTTEGYAEMTDEDRKKIIGETIKST